jgi:hypothetical protein
MESQLYFWKPMRGSDRVPVVVRKIITNKSNYNFGLFYSAPVHKPIPFTKVK